MRRGAGVLLAGAVLLLVAFTFDAAPLFVVSVGLLALVALSAAWVWLAARWAAIERGELPARVLEGEALLAEVSLSGGPFGLPGVTIRDPLDSEELRRPPRGLHRIAPPALVLGDPFGLAHAAKRAAGGERQVLVLPRTEPVRPPAASGETARMKGGASRPEPFGAVDVDGLRPYRPGTPAARIHWAALARGAGLLERRLQADGDHLPLVVLDARCPQDAPREQLDAAVRAAASLILALAVAGGCRALLPGSRRPSVLVPDLIAWDTVHARLALVEGGPSAPPPLLSGRTGDHPAIYVSASRHSPAGLGRHLLVLPTELIPHGTRPRFSVSGCSGFSVGAGSTLRAA